MPNVNTEESNNAQSRLLRQSQKKAARHMEARRLRYKKTSKKVVYWLVGLAVVSGGLWWLVASSLPKGSDFSMAVETLGAQHIAEGSSYPGYNSNPPTSGPHYPNPALPQFYDQELADEQVVHNLEHGHIWISYKPGLRAENIEKLRKLAGGNIIVTPRSKNDTDLALAAWGRLDKFNIENGLLDVQRIRDFILRYQNKGPENPSGLRGHLR